MSDQSGHVGHKRAHGETRREPGNRLLDVATYPRQVYLEKAAETARRHRRRLI